MSKNLKFIPFPLVDPGFGKGGPEKKPNKLGSCEQKLWHSPTTFPGTFLQILNLHLCKYITIHVYIYAQKGLGNFTNAILLQRSEVLIWICLQIHCPVLASGLGTLAPEAVTFFNFKICFFLLKYI